MFRTPGICHQPHFKGGETELQSPSWESGEAVLSLDPRGTVVGGGGVSALPTALSHTLTAPGPSALMPADSKIQVFFQVSFLEHPPAESIFSPPSVHHQLRAPF